MSLFQWLDIYSVHIQQFDEQHEKLINLMNELHDNIKLRKDKSALESILGELFKYSETHFKEEIEILQQNGYPEIAAHIAEHDKFINELKAIRNKLGHQGNLLNLQLLIMLKDWLINHIMRTDMKYSEFLRAKGLK